VLGDVAQGVDDGVGLAGADLQDEVTAGDRRLQVVVGEDGLRGDPERRVLEQARARADGDGEAVGRDVEAEGPAVGRRLAGAEVRGDAAAGEEAGPRGQRLEQIDQFAPGGRGDVGDDEGRLGRRGVEDPGLMEAVEGDRGEPRGGVDDDGALVGARAASAATAAVGAARPAAAVTAAAPERVRNWRRSTPR
jgi:hypothetical protein